MERSSSNIEKCLIFSDISGNGNPKKASLLKFVFIMLLTFPICHIFIKKIFMFYRKIHAFSLMRISFICTHFWK